MSLFIVGVGRAARNESDSLVKASSERLKSHIREIGGLLCCNVYLGNLLVSQLG